MIPEYLPIITAFLTIICLLLLFGLIMLKQKHTAELDNQLKERDMLIVSLEESNKKLEQSKINYAEEETRSVALDRQNAIYKERNDGLLDKTNKFDQLQRQLTEAFSQIKVLETMLENEQKTGSEKLELLEKNRKQMKMEFKELADSILKNNSEHFSHQNSENLTKMITPIREQFDAFKKQINDVYIKETKERSMLQAEINHIKEINLQMSKEANSLTNALKGESKTQGIWGEMILEKVLENSGLRAGESYKREVSLEHESDNSRYRPDVIVYLPDQREIIIDAKTSLRAYEQYVSAEDEDQKHHYANQHLASMRKHIRELSDKDYTGLKGVETLDFIFMFVPIESALLMAMEHDSGLFDHAFKKNVILVGPTTLMVALRAVENTWKQEHQQQNAMEIARRAGLLYDKFVGFVESVEKLGKQIGIVQKTYDDAYGKLHGGAGSLTSQFHKLEKLGAAASKKLPDHVARQIEE
ncbi:MAG: DNA recombination protein RmuC [Campylobacterota bacterium]|nr:DNA recombination protein RmuC [Campylobacterota bacterium]